MSEIMQRHCISVFSSQFIKMVLDDLIVHRNNKFLIGLMRNSIDQIHEVLRNNEFTSRAVGLVDTANDILICQTELAALNRHHTVLDITELKTTNLADTEGKPHREHTGELNIGPANHTDHLLRSRQILDNRLLRRQRDIQLQPDTVHFQRGDNQTFGFTNRLRMAGCCILVDRLLHIETVQLMNFKIHNALQTVIENVLIPVNRRRRQNIPFQLNVIPESFSNRSLVRIQLCQTVEHKIFHGLPLCFAFGRCGDGFLSLDTVLVLTQKNLYPPGAGRHFLCSCHSILLFQGIHYIPSLIVYTFSCNL